ncbi:Ras GTPase-activating protein,Rho GTPase activation protein [Cinara cedri]|uniref:Ras GTPase-activating protein,Rho GTPase activation protein n=1 Tax=Cinara cedri TaxID=506608 RepID=A0A5E4ME90_9HEMI|nr:Ras GTPase-activating protein,Rho GTPase activation protein [Cinara cedri]
MRRGRQNQRGHRHVMQKKKKKNSAKEFLWDIAMTEKEKVEGNRLTFRGNSPATKATEAYLKLTDEKYLHETFSELVSNGMQTIVPDCEVDPLRVGKPGFRGGAEGSTSPGPTYVKGP